MQSGEVVISSGLYPEGRKFESCLCDQSPIGTFRDGLAVAEQVDAPVLRAEAAISLRYSYARCKSLPASFVAA